MLRGLIAVVVAALLGCAGAGGPPPAYSPQDLEQKCQRDGGWWRPSVGSGYCERV